MFFKISFSSWRNLVRRYIEANGITGLPSSEDPQAIVLAAHDKKATGIPVEFNYYENQAYTSEEEEVEEDASPSKSASQHPTEKQRQQRRSRRHTTFAGGPLSPTSGAKTDDLLAESVASSRAAKSPELHRKIAKKLKLDAERRLSSLDAFAFPSRLSLLRVSSPSKRGTTRNVDAHEVSMSSSTPSPDVTGAHSKRRKVAEPPFGGGGVSGAPPGPRGS
jgi:hypothetical protein